MAVQAVRSVLRQYKEEFRKKIEICHVLSAQVHISMHSISLPLHSVDCDGQGGESVPFESACYFPFFPKSHNYFDSALDYIYFLIYFFSSLYSSLPSWLPPAMLEIHILALYPGDHELCSKYFVKVNSVV